MKQTLDNRKMEQSSDDTEMEQSQNKAKFTQLRDDADFERALKEESRVKPEEMQTVNLVGRDTNDNDQSGESQRGLDLKHTTSDNQNAGDNKRQRKGFEQQPERRL